MREYNDKDCPERIGADPVDMCNLSGRICEIECGYACEEWDRIKSQWEEEHNE